jgi:hypothetical protein
MLSSKTLPFRQAVASITTGLGTLNQLLGNRPLAQTFLAPFCVSFPPQGAQWNCKGLSGALKIHGIPRLSPLNHRRAKSAGFPVGLSSIFPISCLESTKPSDNLK